MRKNSKTSWVYTKLLYRFSHFCWANWTVVTSLQHQEDSHTKHKGRLVPCHGKLSFKLL